MSGAGTSAVGPETYVRCVPANSKIESIFHQNAVTKLVINIERIAGTTARRCKSGEWIGSTRACYVGDDFQIEKQALVLYKDGQ